MKGGEAFVFVRPRQQVEYELSAGTVSSDGESVQDTESDSDGLQLGVSREAAWHQTANAASGYEDFVEDSCSSSSQDEANDNQHTSDGFESRPTMLLSQNVRRRLRHPQVAQARRSAGFTTSTQVLSSPNISADGLDSLRNPLDTACQSPARPLPKAHHKAQQTACSIGSPHLSIGFHQTANAVAVEQVSPLLAKPLWSPSPGRPEEGDGNDAQWGGESPSLPAMAIPVVTITSNSEDSVETDQYASMDSPESHKPVRRLPRCRCYELESPSVPLQERSHVAACQEGGVTASRQRQHDAAVPNNHKHVHRPSTLHQAHAICRQCNGRQKSRKKEQRRDSLGDWLDTSDQPNQKRPRRLVHARQTTLTERRTAQFVQGAARASRNEAAGAEELSGMQAPLQEPRQTFNTVGDSQADFVSSHCTAAATAATAAAATTPRQLPWRVCNELTSLLATAQAGCLAPNEPLGETSPPLKTIASTRFYGHAFLNKLLLGQTEFQTLTAAMLNRLRLWRLVELGSIHMESSNAEEPVKAFKQLLEFITMQVYHLLPRATQPQLQSQFTEALARMLAAVHAELGPLSSALTSTTTVEYPTASDQPSSFSVSIRVHLMICWHAVNWFQLLQARCPVGEARNNQPVATECTYDRVLKLVLEGNLKAAGDTYVGCVLEELFEAISAEPATCLLAPKISHSSHATFSQQPFAPLWVQLKAYHDSACFNGSMFWDQLHACVKRAATETEDHAERGWAALLLAACLQLQTDATTSSGAEPSSAPWRIAVRMLTVRPLFVKLNGTKPMAMSIQGWLRGAEWNSEQGRARIILQRCLALMRCFPTDIEVPVLLWKQLQNACKQDASRPTQRAWSCCADFAPFLSGIHDEQTLLAPVPPSEPPCHTILRIIYLHFTSKHPRTLAKVVSEASKLLNMVMPSVELGAAPNTSRDAYLSCLLASLRHSVQLILVLARVLPAEQHGGLLKRLCAMLTSLPRIHHDVQRVVLRAILLFGQVPQPNAMGEALVQKVAAEVDGLLEDIFNKTLELGRPLLESDLQEHGGTLHTFFSTTDQQHGNTLGTVLLDEIRQNVAKVGSNAALNAHCFLTEGFGNLIKMHVTGHHAIRQSILETLNAILKCAHQVQPHAPQEMQDSADDLADIEQQVLADQIQKQFAKAIESNIIMHLGEMLHHATVHASTSNTAGITLANDCLETAAQAWSLLLRANLRTWEHFTQIFGSTTQWCRSEHWHARHVPGALLTRALSLRDLPNAESSTQSQLVAIWLLLMADSQQTCQVLLTDQLQHICPNYFDGVSSPTSFSEVLQTLTVDCVRWRIACVRKVLLNIGSTVRGQARNSALFQFWKTALAVLAVTMQHCWRNPRTLRSDCIALYGELCTSVIASTLCCCSSLFVSKRDSATEAQLQSFLQLYFSASVFEVQQESLDAQQVVHALAALDCTRDELCLQALVHLLHRTVEFTAAHCSGAVPATSKLRQLASTFVLDRQLPSAASGTGMKPLAKFTTSIVLPTYINQCCERDGLELAASLGVKLLHAIILPVCPTSIAVPALVELNGGHCIVSERGDATSLTAMNYSKSLADCFQNLLPPVLTPLLKLSRAISTHSELPDLMSVKVSIYTFYGEVLYLLGRFPQLVLGWRAGLRCALVDALVHTCTGNICHISCWLLSAPHTEAGMQQRANLLAADRNAIDAIRKLFELTMRTISPPPNFEMLVMKSRRLFGAHAHPLLPPSSDAGALAATAMRLLGRISTLGFRERQCVLSSVRVVQEAVIAAQLQPQLGGPKLIARQQLVAHYKALLTALGPAGAAYRAALVADPPSPTDRTGHVLVRTGVRAPLMNWVT
eukprot:jgi/Chlat1/458/Chrsp103S01069